MAWRKKNKKNAPIVQMSDEDVEALEERVREMVKSQLPLGRVKKVVRMNPDIEMLNSEALQLMTKAAEMFIKELSNAANQNATMEKRKTIQAKDIDKVIKKTLEFSFLEDALDDWPKLEPKKRKAPGNSSQEDAEDTPMDSTVVGEEPEEEEEAEEEEHDVEETEDVGDDQQEEADENEEEELPETVPEFDEKEDEDHQMRDPFAEQF